MKNKIIKIIKIPLPAEEKASLNKPQYFPRMPRLYLELLENKAKIKQDLINKDYIPIIENKKIDQVIQQDIINEVPKEIIIKKDEIDIEDIQEKEKEKEKENINRYTEDDNKYSVENKYSYDKEEKYVDNNKDNDFDNYISSNTKKDSGGTPSSNISDRLQELLKEDPKNKYEKNNNYEDKYNRQRNNIVRSVEQYKKSIGIEQNQLPPALSEIEKQGNNSNLRDIKDDIYDEDAKRELMFKMDLLRKSYPNSTIPEYSIHSDYNNMKRTYENTVRRLSLDSSVENYKTYLIGGFMVCEFVLGNYLGFDMIGFTQQQILTMNSYEILLIELGEKSYIPGGSKWPVEIRLLFMILSNAGLFIISKMIMKSTGSNLIGLINNMNRGGNTSNTNEQTSTSNASSNKRKMKEPNINFNDLPEIPK